MSCRKSHAHEEPHEQTIEGKCSVRNFCRNRIRTKSRTNKPLKESARCETFAACAFVRIGTLLGRCWDVAGMLPKCCRGAAATLRDIAVTLPGRCRDVAGTSPERSRDVAALPGRCWVVAGTLPGRDAAGHCQDTGTLRERCGTLPGRCRNAAATLPERCRGAAGTKSHAHEEPHEQTIEKNARCETFAEIACAQETEQTNH